MNVYIYWNRKDLDCKKIYHCMSRNDDKSIINELEKKNNLTIERVTTGYKDSVKIEEKISKNDVIIFCTHGTTGEILKYRGKYGEDTILISEDNLHLLDGKVVLAFCCSSAAGLGKKSICKPYSCISYVGFETDILYDNGRAQKSRHIIYEAYKNAFSKAIIYAIKTNCSVHEFRIVLMQQLRYASVEAVLGSNDQSIATIYAGAIAGVVSYGEQGKTIFS